MKWEGVGIKIDEVLANLGLKGVEINHEKGNLSVIMSHLNSPHISSSCEDVSFLMDMYQENRFKSHCVYPDVLLKFDCNRLEYIHFEGSIGWAKSDWFRSRIK